MRPLPLSRLRYRPIRWLWPGRIPYGTLTLLAGRIEVGKSSLLSDVAARVSRGSPFPDCEEHGEPGRVLVFCSEEDPESALLARAEEQGGDLSRIAVEDTPFLLDEHYDRLARLLRQKGPTLLIFDPLSSYLRHHQGQGLRDELVRLNRFLRRHTVAAIGAAHLVKAAHKTVLAGMRGGGQLSEVVRHILALARVDPADPASAVLLGVVKSNLTGGDVSHIGFRITRNPKTRRPRLLWLPDTDVPEIVSLDELVAKASKQGRQSRTKLATVEEALAAALEGGPAPQKLLFARLTAETGAGKRTIDEAKKRLRVTSERRGGEWWWRGPAPTQPDTAEKDAPPTPNVEEEHPFPITSYIEQQRRKGKSASEIVARLEEHATKTEEACTRANGAVAAVDGPSRPARRRGGR